MRSNRAIATWRCIVLAVCGWLLVVAVAPAMDSRDRTIAQFYHTAWTVREGAPGQITALAQSRDGYLWLGTQTGLYRFDGARFERYRPREGGEFLASSVASLYAPPSGGLWVGFRYGVASFIDGDRATHYASASGLPTATIYAIDGTPDGRIWAATFRGLALLKSNRWTLVGPAMGLPGERARNLSVDSGGRLWVATDKVLASLPPGGDRFTVATTQVGRINRIAEAPDGSIWVAEADGGVRPVWNGTMHADDVGPVLRLSSAGLLFDRDGALWMPTLGDGLRRVPHVEELARQVIDADGTAAQRFVERDGLSSDYVGAVMQDREGNIWVGGSRGLDRFRVSRLLPAALPAGATDFAMVPADGHGIWVGTKNRPLIRVGALGVMQGSFAEAITTASRDREGTWLAGPGGIWRMHDGVPQPYAPLPTDGYTGVQAITGDGQGGAWLSINHPGVYHFTQGRWIHDPLSKLPDDPSPLVMLHDAHGRLWMGFSRDTIVVREGTHDRMLRGTDGLYVGNVTALFEDGDTVWVGGERGIAGIVGDRAHMISTTGEPLRAISGLVRDARGDFWMNAAQGVARIGGADMARALRDPDYRAPVTLFDSLDGLPGTPAQFRPLPTAALADDGRLWFATTSGIVSIDPANVPYNPIPPPVSIRSIATDAGAWDAAPTVSLPARTERLSIAYTATSLTMPERVRFRYRMEGIDTRWREAGTDREAVYTDPPPGRHVFRVTAANEDGVWNETGASIVLDVAPAFYQTLWFAALCVAVLLGSLWLAYLSRVRRIKAQLRARLQERHAERERIARDLHDTLLQSIQGLTMRFQAIANRIPPDDPLRISMETALDRAGEALVEARDRVRDLRAHAREGATLEGALETLSLAYAVDHTVPVVLHATVDTRGLHPRVCDEYFGIAREAVHNAVTHAEASRVDVTLEAVDGELRLDIGDDGRGMEGEVLREGREGHWGLRGIRERAAAIDATVAITSHPATGTTVSVHMPLSRAFPGVSKRWWRLWRR